MLPALVQVLGAGAGAGSAFSWCILVQALDWRFLGACWCRCWRQVAGQRKLLIITHCDFSFRHYELFPYTPAISGLCWCNVIFWAPHSIRSLFPLVSPGAPAVLLSKDSGTCCVNVIIDQCCYSRPQQQLRITYQGQTGPANEHLPLFVCTM